MRIALVSTAFEDTPPVGYGGTERVVALLAEGLQDRGHAVTLFASGSSTCRTELRSWFMVPQRPYDVRRDVVHTAWALHQARTGYDIVHTHTKVGPFLASLVSDVPVVHTLHNNARDYVAVPTHPFVALSRFQASIHPGLAVAGVVHNGVNLDEWPFHPSGGDYLVFLGRFGARRAPHVAISAARASGVDIVLAGKIEDPTYFDREVRPHVDGVHVRCVGELGPERASLLGGALALISPLTIDDPFGLAHIEALACGTPVLGVRRGALAELVTPETGVLVDTPEDLARGVPAVRMVDRRACRQRAERVFSHHCMVEGYLDIYSSILGRR